MTLISNDLLPPTVDIIIPQGSDTKEFFQLYTDIEKTIPLDLTGLSANCMLRTSYDSRTPVLTLSSEASDIILGAALDVNGNIILDNPSNGGICVIYKNESTTAIKFTGDSIDLVRDIELSDTSGTIRRILQGTITLSREVTR